MLSWLSRRRCKIDIFRALDAFRRELKRPCDDERDWKPDRDQYDHQPHNPSWNFQEWKDLRGNLNQEPADNRVGNGNFVNVAPLQFGEEVPRFHLD